MTPENNSSQPNRPESNVTVESQNGASPTVPPESGTIVATAEPVKPMPPPATRKVLLPQQPEQTTTEKSASALTLGLIAAMIFGLANDNIWLGLIGAVGAIGISLRLMWPSWGAGNSADLAHADRRLLRAFSWDCWLADAQRY